MFAECNKSDVFALLLFPDFKYLNNLNTNTGHAVISY